MTRYRSFAPSTGTFVVVPEENEKSEPFSNRKQVRIFLVWWRERDSNPCPAINRLPHFEFFLLHGTWWKIEGISPLCQKIRTIEFTLKISSRSQITRLCADLNPLSKTQKNQPFGENGERFYARWRERAREIPGAKIHPYNMLPSDADQIKAAKDG